MAAATLQDELEALRRELSTVPIMEDDGSSAAPAREAPVDDDARSEVERVVHELQTHLTDAADDAGEMVSAHPVASVAAAFLLGVVAGSLLMRIGTR